MATLLTITVILTLSGGLVTLMVVDCLEGIISQLFYLVIIVGLLCVFHWSQIREVLMDRPPGHSFLNPLDAGEASDFNLTFVLMTVCTSAYARMAWQNSSAYNSAALNAHESRMGGLLGYWRELGKVALVALLAVSAMTFLGHVDFAGQATHAKQLISQIQEPQIQVQMRIPIAVTEMLPVSIKGLLCAILIMGVFGGDSTHLHSWGGILVQDVFLPLRKKPFSPNGHIRALRFAIIGVAVFAFGMGALFRQTEYITMWFQVTTGVFVSGAGAAIIGGLYWKRGTAAGAWTGMLTGSCLSLTGIVLRQIYGKAFGMNGAQIYFTASLAALTLYVIVSLLTWKEDFNMDRMLHRGKYAPAAPAGSLSDVPPAKKLKLTWGKLIGIDENFTIGDKWIAGGIVGWCLFWFVVMVIGTGGNLISPWPITAWATFWHFFGVGVPIIFALMTGVWFTWGGLRDMRRLFANLKNERVNHLDDGTVVGHQNLDEVAAHQVPSAKSESGSQILGC